MAEIQYTVERPNSVADRYLVMKWPAMSPGDAGTPFPMAEYPDRSVQVSGTFGVGGAVQIQGSIDGVNFSPLTDPQGNSLTLSTPKIEAVSELVKFIRPVVTGGDGTTSLNVHMIMRTLR